MDVSPAFSVAYYPQVNLWATARDPQEAHALAARLYDDGRPAMLPSQVAHVFRLPTGSGRMRLEARDAEAVSRLVTQRLGLQLPLGRDRDDKVRRDVQYA